MPLTQTYSLNIDLGVLSTLRSILFDTDETAFQFSDQHLIAALTDNRRTVLFRDPAYTATGIVPYVLFSAFRARVPLNDSNLTDTHLIPDMDGQSYQARPAMRHWDSTSSVIVWRNGVKQDPTLTNSAYTIDYPAGRVSFTNITLSDWESINASFSYFPLYRIARQLIAQLIGSNAPIIGEKIGLDAWTYAGLMDRLHALDTVLADFAPTVIRRNKRVY